MRLICVLDGTISDSPTVALDNYRYLSQAARNQPAGIQCNCIAHFPLLPTACVCMCVCLVTMKHSTIVFRFSLGFFANNNNNSKKHSPAAAFGAKCKVTAAKNACLMTSSFPWHVTRFSCGGLTLLYQNTHLLCSPATKTYFCDVILSINKSRLTTNTGDSLLFYGFVHTHNLQLQ